MPNKKSKVKKMDKKFSKEGTCHYICEKCLQSCDIQPAEHCTGCTDPDSFDLPEGRTHQMGTIEHPTNHPEEWEKKFRVFWKNKDIEDRRNFNWNTYQKMLPDNLINFIRCLLAAQKKELLAEIREWIEKKKRP